MSDVVVVDYGAGNTRSVCAALAKIGRSSVVTSDPEAVRGADFVVLPGVGSARSAMAELDRTGAAQALRERFAGVRPTLGICLGLQLALEMTEEDGGVTGLGLLEGRAVRLAGERVPRLGWALVEPWGEVYYFAHSFAPESPHEVAASEGVTVAVECDGFLGVQFHPEKSGEAGLNLLDRCLSRA